MKKTSFIAITLLIASLSACSDYKCKDKCCAADAKKTTASEACAKCGKNSCDKKCAASHDTSKLKSLVPSCNLSEEQMQARREMLREGIFSKVKSVEAMSTGYQLTFNEPIEFSNELLEFVNFERDCCAGFTFALVFEPNNKASHLQLYGSKEIKEELRGAFVELGVIK